MEELLFFFCFLFCFVLFCFVLFCFVLFCFVLFVLFLVFELKIIRIIKKNEKIKK